MKYISPRMMAFVNQGIANEGSIPIDSTIRESAYSKQKLSQIAKEAESEKSVNRRAVSYFYNLLTMHPFKKENIRTAIDITRIYLSQEGKMLKDLDYKDLMELAFLIVSKQVGLSGLENTFEFHIKDVPNTKIKI